MTWLDEVQAALIAEGFYQPPQDWKWEQGQVFGLAEDLDNCWQLHVRGFRVEEKERLESEIEPQWKYLEHRNPEHRADGCVHLIRILDKYSIPYVTQGNCYYAPPKVPAQLTDWRPIFVFAVLVGLGFFFGSLGSKK